MVEKIIEVKLLSGNDWEVSNQYGNTLLIVNSGEIKLTVGQKSFCLESERAVVIPENEFYAIIGKTEGAEALAVRYKTDTDEALTLITFSDLEYLLAKRIVALYLKGGEQNYGLISSAVSIILSKIIDTGADLIEWNTEKSALLFQKITDKMLQNISGNITLPELADYFNISLSALKRLFLKYTNLGVCEYFTDRKIAFSKQLLLDGISVGEVARKCGFKNQNYFSSTFKKVTDVTPKEFVNIENSAKMPLVQSANFVPPKAKPVKRKSPPKSGNDMPSYLL